ncbi:MAG: hypothetical protein ACRCWM_02395 [Sarcina sp.]
MLFKRKHIDASMYYIEAPTRPTEATKKLNKIESISRLDYELKHQHQQLEELKSTRDKYESYGELEKVVELDAEIKRIENKIHKLINENGKGKEVNLNWFQQLVMKLIGVNQS